MTHGRGLSPSRTQLTTISRLTSGGGEKRFMTPGGLPRRTSFRCWQPPTLQSSRRARLPIGTMGEPGAVLGCEGEFEAADRLIGEPNLGLLGDVCGMIVEDQLDRSMGRIGGIDEREEFDEFAAAVAVLDESVNLAGE